jgi:hypothetical protein
MSLLKRWMKHEDLVHFIGQMIFVDEKGNQNLLFCYDGQQRLISMQVIISSVIALLNPYVSKMDRSDKMQFNKLKKLLLSDDGEFAIVPSSSDRNAYRTVFTYVSNRYSELLQQRRLKASHYIEKARVTCEGVLHSRILNKANGVQKLLKFSEWLLDNVRWIGLMNDDHQWATEQFIAINLGGKTLDRSDAIKAMLFSTLTLEEQEEAQIAWDEIDRQLREFLKLVKVKRLIKIKDMFLLIFADHSNFSRGMIINQNFIYNFRENYEMLCHEKGINPNYSMLFADMVIMVHQFVRLAQDERLRRMFETTSQYGVLTAAFLVGSNKIPNAYREHVLRLIELSAREIEVQGGNVAAAIGRVLRSLVRKTVSLNHPEKDFGRVLASTYTAICDALKISEQDLLSRLNCSLSKSKSA